MQLPFDCRYVALNTLLKSASTDLAAVQRHRNMIVECIKDADNTIRRRALDLVYCLVNDSNVQVRDARFNNIVLGFFGFSAWLLPDSIALDALPWAVRRLQVFIIVASASGVYCCACSTDSKSSVL